MTHSAILTLRERSREGRLPLGPAAQNFRAVCESEGFPTFRFRLFDKLRAALGVPTLRGGYFS